MSEIAMAHTSVLKSKASQRFPSMLKNTRDMRVSSGMVSEFLTNLTSHTNSLTGHSTLVRSVFDKIVSIKVLDKQQVYDLEIEKTHNFIANDIVAYNTYLATSGVGTVGINTTVPANTLTVQGTLNVTSQNTRSGDLFVASSGNVGIGTASPSSTLTVNGNISTQQTNNTLGNFTIVQYNASCSGFTFNMSVGGIFYCHA